MNALRYSEWTGTCDTIHMILQMMGKVKLARMAAQPEWGHVLLHPKARGFYTGLIPYGEKSFDILFNFRNSMVYAHNMEGETAGFPLVDGQSVADYYRNFRRMLHDIGADTEINPTPVETLNTTPFQLQTEKRNYDYNCALDYFKNCVMAHNALLEFVAPYRGKKILPSMFWGTFDMTAILFAGEDRPYTGKGFIERAAFDEKMVEFGYWPGDPVWDPPSFFIMPYPFPEADYTGAQIRPHAAYYNAERKQFMLPMEEVLRLDDPHQAIKNFCADAFEIIAGTEDWKNMDWLQKPLQMHKKQRVPQHV